MIRRLAIVGLWLAVAAGVAAIVWRVPGVFRGTDRAVAQVHGQSRAGRALLPARSFDLVPDLFVAAAQSIPPDATYYVLAGNDRGDSALTLSKAPVFASYWLLPRRRLVLPDNAQWIIAYGAQLTSLPLKYGQITTVYPGYSFAEVER